MNGSNDGQEHGSVEFEPKLRLIIDQLGDPYVWVNIEMPVEAALTADQCEQVALKMLAAAAASRARAGVVRKQLFAGVAAIDAVRFASEMLDE